MNRGTVMADVLQPKEGKHLGDLCGWGLSGTFLQEHVQELAKKHGLGEDLGLPKLSPGSAYRRAVTDCVRSGRRDEEKYAAVKIDETELKIVHAIVRRDIVDAAGGELSPKDAAFETECKVGFDKEAYKDGRDPEVMIQMSNPDHEIAKKFKQTYEELCVRYLPGDIRVAFQRAFDSWGSIRLLDHGGLWWVPEPSSSKVRDWKDFMQELGNTTVVIPVFDTEETINSLRMASESTLEGQLLDMMEQLTKFSTKGNTRLSTLEKRVEMFDDLRAKVELHARVLGNTQTDLLTRLDAAHSGLVKSLQAITK